MQIDVNIVASLTDEGVGGNPAGVVVDANGLDADQKLRIAQQVGLSETAFVSKSEIATVKLEFFTPTRQIAHCGHATIAAFSLLGQLGRIADGWSSKETIDGCRRVLIQDEVVLMEQRSPIYRPITPDSELATKIAASIGISLANIFDVAVPTVVSTGNRFLMIALRDERAVADVQPQQEAIEAISEALDLIGYYVFSTTTRVSGRHAGARMFAPRFGIPEESATGTAAGPLACFLHERMGIEDREMAIEQGRLMQPASPSLIKVTLDANEGGIARVMAGGTASVKENKGVEI